MLIKESTLFLVCILVSAYGKADATKCDDGWFGVGTQCYVVIPIPKSFTEAIALCQTSSFGGDLVQLETVHEKSALVAHMKNTYELIFTGQLFWVSAKGGQSVFVWNDGTPLTYADFVDVTGQGVGCLAFGSTTLDKYQVDPCSNQHLVICEKSLNHTTTATQPQVG